MQQSGKPDSKLNGPALAGASAFASPAGAGAGAVAGAFDPTQPCVCMCQRARGVGKRQLGCRFVFLATHARPPPKSSHSYGGMSLLPPAHTAATQSYTPFSSFPSSSDKEVRLEGCPPKADQPPQTVETSKEREGNLPILRKGFVAENFAALHNGADSRSNPTYPPLLLRTTLPAWNVRSGFLSLLFLIITDCIFNF